VTHCVPRMRKPGASVVVLALLGGLGWLGSACGSRSPDGALKVLIDWDPDVRAACVRVQVFQDGGAPRQTPGLPRDAGREPLVVAVYQDGQGEEAEVQAVGFQAGCLEAMDPPEASARQTARYAYPDPQVVPLRLSVQYPDGGQGCDGGVPFSCGGVVPTCQQLFRCGAGSCVLRPAPAATSCSDGLTCTTSDACDGDGGCVGVAQVCASPAGNPCLTGLCTEPAGCGVVAVPAASCDDSSACTVDDTCLADGGCAGTPVVCPAPGPCQTGGTCNPASGACEYGLLGGPCDGGACNAMGQCAPDGGDLFSYLPSNFTEAQLPVMTPDQLTISCAASLDTQTADGGLAYDAGCPGGPVPNLSVILQDGGTGPSAVLMFTSNLSILSGGSLTVVGARPLIIAVLGLVQVSGPVTTLAGSERDCAAPPDGGTFNGRLSGSWYGGGGGAGFGVAGSGDGSSGPGGLGQGTSGNQALIPLRGGCQGGQGGPSTPAGAGGGALQVSATGSITISAAVSAPGQGGAGGPTQLRGGGGGGSGGGLLLEGTQIALTSGGRLAANGGGGGEGSDSYLSGHPGSAGGTTTFAAAGGSNGTVCGGNGGQGDALGFSSQPGFRAPGGLGCHNIGGEGGAGAGMGRIRLNAVTSCTISPGVVSPSPTVASVACN
jgi:hypothetical protein